MEGPSTCRLARSELISPGTFLVFVIGDQTIVLVMAQGGWKGPRVAYIDIFAYPSTACLRLVYWRPRWRSCGTRRRALIPADTDGSPDKKKLISSIRRARNVCSPIHRTYSGDTVGKLRGFLSTNREHCTGHDHRNGKVL
jgi:hypothetical protein